MKPKRTFTFLFVLLFPFFVFGQQPGLEGINKKFSAGILFSPDYSYRRLQMDDDPYKLIEMRNEYESPKISYTFMLLLASTGGVGGSSQCLVHHLHRVFGCAARSVFYVVAARGSGCGDYRLFSGIPHSRKKHHLSNFL
jgi:hypothetical protein